MVPWICDALLSNHSVKAYGRDFMDFVRHMQAQGVTPLEVTADHVKLYKRALLEAGMTSATVARRLSVLRGAYEQLAAKGLVSWETAKDIAAVKAPGVQKNATPSLTQKQAIALLQAIPTDSLQGIRDLALMSVFFLTGCRVSAVTGVCVGHLETDGVEHYLNVTEKRYKKRRKILLDAARPVLAYVARAGIKDDREGPLFRPMQPDGSGFVRRHLDRKTPWRLVKKYCEAAGIDPSRLGSRGVTVHTPDIDPARTEEVREPSRLLGLLWWRGFAPINWCWGPVWERVRHGSWRGRLRGENRKPSNLVGCKWRLSSRSARASAGQFRYANLGLCAGR